MAVRLLAIVVAGLGVLAPALAHSDSGEELRARGEQLAKDGRYSEAIDAFKAAEKIEPRARHACLIALAYTRREAWPQAEIWLAQCEARATPADPLPEWVPIAKQQLADRLSTVNVAAVEIKVEPAGTDVKLAVSSFAPDELFTPRTIHLPPGRHVIVATAKGYNDAQKTVDVGPDKASQTVTITLLPLEPTPRHDGGSVAAPAPAPARSKVPFAVMGAGGGVILAGAALHLFYFKPVRDDLKAAPDKATYDQLSSKFDTRRNVTIAVYGLGAATVLTGLILELTVFKTHESPVQVALTPHEGGGVVSVGWSR